VPQPPVSDEVSAALAQFFFSGDGPSHSKLSNAFTGAGHGSDDPYSPTPRPQTRKSEYGPFWELPDAGQLARESLSTPFWSSCVYMEASIPTGLPSPPERRSRLPSERSAGVDGR